jgi:Fe-S-cluster containining protein
MVRDSLAQTISNATWQALSQRKRIRESIRVTESVHDRVESTMDELVERARQVGLGEPHCQKGCWYCCQIRVHVSVPEVVRVARYLQETLDSDALRGLVDRLNAYRAQLLPLERTPYFETRILCPLNEEGACTVHAVRPIVCRRYLSFDVDRCREHFVDNLPSRIPKLDAIPPAVEPFLAGLVNGATRAEQPSLVDFPFALAIALTGDNLERWQRGAPIFQECAARQ